MKDFFMEYGDLVLTLGVIIIAAIVTIVALILTAPCA